MNKSAKRTGVILKSAREKFARYGYSKVTMEEIAADINLTKPSLYYYFPTKDDLFKEVIKSEQEQFLSDIKKLIEKKAGASDKLLTYAGKRLEYFRNLINLGTMIVHPNNNRESTYKLLFDDFEVKELKMIKAIFTEGIKSSEFVNKLPGGINHLFLHMLQGLRMRSLRTVTDKTLDETIFNELRSETKKIVNIFIKGIQK